MVAFNGHENSQDRPPRQDTQAGRDANATDGTISEKFRVMGNIVARYCDQLPTIILRWPTLPEETRAEILTLCRK